MFFGTQHVVEKLLVDESIVFSVTIDENLTDSPLQFARHAETGNCL